MRILPFSPSFEGYEPGFVDLNHEEGLLDISHPSSCVLIEDRHLYAENLSLRCTIRPSALTNKSSKVQLISEGDPLAEARLYDENMISPGYEGDPKFAQWSAIELDYSGRGQGVYEGEKFVFSGSSLPFGTLQETRPLYVKPFVVEKESYQVRTITMAREYVLTSPPGVLNTHVLRGYGGYYHPGIPPAHVEQIYYALTSEYDQTRVRLYSSSQLQAQHTPPPRGGRNFNHDILFSPLPREEEYLSLEGALIAGYARFSLKTATGLIQYASYSCEAVPEVSTSINVNFRPLSTPSLI